MSTFEEYFLKFQQEGQEVYLGEDIALVVYEQEKVIAIEGVRCNGIFLSFDELGGLEKNLTEIRSPNLKGVQPNLTNILFEMWKTLVCFVESKNQYYLDLFYGNSNNSTDVEF